MDAGAEGQRALAGALAGDVELGAAALGVAVGLMGADDHDRVLGEDDAAVLDLLHHDPRRERGHRRDADDLRDGVGGAVGLAAEQLPLVGVGGEQPQRVGEL